MVTLFNYRPICHWLSSILIFAFLMVGCAGFPPSPKLSPSLLEEQTRISGSGVRRGTVEILVNGKPVTRGSVDRDENFTLDIPSLAAGQIVTATQSVGGWTSAPSLPVTVQKTALAQKNLIVLLDNQDGTVGMINVTNAGGTRVLDQSRQAVRVGSATTAPSQPFVLNKDQIEEVFKDALDAIPEAPLKFILYFEPGTTELSPDSARQLPDILSIIANRSVPDIGVIGHTDRTSSEEYNHQVSLDRANAVRNMIVATGVDPKVIEVTGHGENNPLVPTADNVSEPLNRRVEIIVR